MVLLHLAISEAESCVLPLTTSQHHDRALILVEQSTGIPASQNFTLRGFAFTKDLPSCPFTIGCAMGLMELSVCAGEVPVWWPSCWTASFQDAVTDSACGHTPSLMDALPGPWQPGGGWRVFHGEQTVLASSTRAQSPCDGAACPRHLPSEQRSSWMESVYPQRACVH